MSNKLITRCPISNEPLVVQKLYSKKTGITIEGEFNLSKFNLLKDEHLLFIELFVKNRGNIKAVEKELNISYPSVKKLLDETIEGLGYQAEQSEEKPKSSILDILRLVETKKLSIEEALAMLAKRDNS